MLQFDASFCPQQRSLPPRAFPHLMTNLNGSVKCLPIHAAVRANHKSLSENTASNSGDAVFPARPQHISCFSNLSEDVCSVSQATQVNRPPSSQTLASSTGLNTGIHNHHRVNTVRLLDKAITWATFSTAVRLVTCATHRSDGNAPPDPFVSDRHPERENSSSAQL